ncbi:MAG: hypothetical protein QME51_00835 [Planctomycetota bacterium]|nr:hypothetical protein [Planctomycetota bacterium]
MGKAVCRWVYGCGDSVTGETLVECGRLVNLTIRAEPGWLAGMQ